MEAKKYVQFTTPIKTGYFTNELNMLRIEVSYDKGGYNFYGGSIDGRGVYCILTPVHKEEIYESSIIDGNRHNTGYKVFLKPLSRKSQKQIDLCAEKIMPLSDKIVALYEEGKHEEIVLMLKKEFD